MSTPKCRETLTLQTIGGVRGIILHCNKNEKKSVIKHFKEDGTEKWMSDTITSKHLDGSPKTLHIPITVEGVYRLFNQPHLAGWYCFYTSSIGIINYAPIALTDKQTIEQSRESGLSYRDILLGLHKKVY